ncbi:protein kinase domain-containing protein [Archangium lansingense]|uniref:Protein kinase n=1 Tax=Archangium lansingense TaxID=2995310 RepID=A0ABT4A912_9BACT|nr:protein kinase [Archangium lansinium]MCY1078153.1 protein kinase [Archangium lansinium]
MIETPDIFRLGGYRIESLLGRGGMGEVYLAYDERLHRHVALKRIRADGPVDAQARARFRREAQAAARLNHPAIVQIYDILDTEHGDCIVMEYVAGESVAALIKRGPLALAQALRLASAVADGLGEAHAKGLVHRDLKAENVLVTSAGQAKILDFGLALPLWGNSPSPTLTQEGVLLGTVHAMSPEQASGRAVDHRSDIFALGVLLYELVTGRSPFRGSNLLDTLRRVTSEAPAPLTESRPEAPEELVALVERLLEKEPERRPQSARLVAAELTALAARVPVEAAPPLSREGDSPRPTPASGERSGDEPTASRVREAVGALVAPDSAPEVPESGDASMPDWRPAEGQALPRRPHWRLLERLGEGGFGEVWLAAHAVTGERRVFKFCFQPERLRALQREVTLFRLLKEALGEREDIARILDWSFDAPPYFLESEYTAGGSLIDWAARQGGLGQVPLATRLELVAQVAAALAAAHSVGILHKDIKPANVLVHTQPGGSPSIRLTDFGIGLLTDRSVLEAQGITALGFTTADGSGASPGAGTPRYLAPELMNGQHATLQADIYSLGVLLYQMVVGDFSRLLAPGWQRDVGDALLAEDIACFVDGDPGRRTSDAREVAERLRNLEKRRAQREAEQRSQLALEQARRRRTLAVWGAAALTLMLAVVSVFALSAVRAGEQAQAARAEAELRRHQADRLISFMLGDLYGKLEPLGRLGILQDVGDKALEYLATMPEGEQSPEELMQRSKVLGQIGQVRFGQGRFAEASRAFLESLQVARDLVAREPGNGAWLFALGQSEYWVGFSLLQQKELKGALQHFESYLDISRRLVTMDARNTDWQLELAYAHSNIASIQQLLGDGQAASSALGASATIMETLRAQRPEDALLERELAQVYAKLGAAARSRGALPEALKWSQQNLALLESLAARAPEDAGLRRLLGIARSHVGDILLFQGDTRGALAQYEAELAMAQRLAEHDADNVTWRGELLLRYEKVGRCHRILGNLASARSMFDTELRIVRELLAKSPDHRGWRFALARGHMSLASLDGAQGQDTRARGHLQEALAMLEKLGAEAPAEREFPLWRASGLWQLGQLEARAGASSRARTVWDEALTLLGPEEKASEPHTLDIRARLLLGLGRADEARPLLEALDKLGYGDEESLRVRRALLAGGGVVPARAGP